MNVGNALKITCVGFASGVLLRVIQMLYCFDYATGFYTDGGLMAWCSLGVPLLASLAAGFLCFKSRRYFGPYIPRRNTMLGIVAVLSGAIPLITAAMLAADYSQYLEGGFSAYDSVNHSVIHIAFLAATLLFGAVQLFLSVGFFRGKNILKKVPLLYLTAVLWGAAYLILIYVFNGKSSSFVENFFAVVGGATMLLSLFYLCKLLAGEEPESAARRLFILGIPAVILNVTYSFSNLSLLLLGKSYNGEIPAMFQLSTLGVALFLLTFLVTFRRYSIRRTPRADTGELPAVKPGEAPAEQPRTRGGRRFRPN